MQAAAEVVGNIVFSVGKSTCAPESAHDGAGFAADAVFHLVTVDRTFPPVQRIPKLKYADLQRCLRLLLQFIGGENPARSRADDQHIIIHLVLPQSFRSVVSRSAVTGCQFRLLEIIPFWPAKSNFISVFLRFIV